MSFLSNPSTNHMITNLTKRTNEFQAKIDAILNKISTESLPFQKKSFVCCVNCFDTYNTDFESIGKCVNNCQKGTEHFVQVVQNEMQNLQNNLQSCQQVRKKKNKYIYKLNMHYQCFIYFLPFFVVMLL